MKSQRQKRQCGSVPERTGKQGLEQACAHTLQQRGPHEPDERAPADQQHSAAQPTAQRAALALKRKGILTPVTHG